MKIKTLGEAEIIMSNPTSKHNYFAWSTAARLKSGKIAVAASGFRLAHVCPFGKMVISYSEDEGKNFSLPMPVIDTVLDDRDGGVLAFGENNVIVTSFNHTRLLQRREFHKLVKQSEHEYCYGYLNSVTDEEEERDLGSNFRISTDGGVTFGKIFKCPVTSPHGPTELDDGSVLWVGTSSDTKKSRKIEDSAKRDACIIAEQRIEAWRINIDGSCELVGKIPEIIIDGEKCWSVEPHAFNIGKEKLICHIRVQKLVAGLFFTIFQSESEDGGKTWSVPRKILSDKGGAPAHIMKHSSGVLISTYGYREEPYGIRAMFSYDDGKTWDTDYEICGGGDNSDLGYPSTVELKDGSLMTVFYLRKEEKGPAVIMKKNWSFVKE